MRFGGTLILLLLLAVDGAGCAACPEPSAKLPGLNRALLDADVVTIHPVSLNGAHAPRGTMEAAISRIRPYLRGELRIAPMVTRDLGGPVPAQPAVRLSHVTPGPTEVILAYVPAAKGIGRGLFTRFEDGHQQIVFSTEGINAMSGWFFSTRDAWTLVQTHELGHALGIPASADHAWADGHCTQPRCVLYPRMDARSVLSALFAFGPPRGFCGKCRGELQARPSS
jgi:hypothetical protein